MRGTRLLRWSVIALAGVTAGALLGEMTVGTRRVSGQDEPPTYSHLSANPEAAAQPPGGAAPCPDCPDSYGVGARLRGDRNSRTSSAFRELGAVDPDLAAPGEPDDGYRYGGRFPDPLPREASSRTQDAQLATASAPNDETPVAETSAATDGLPAEGLLSF